MLKLFVEQLLDKFPRRLHALRRFMRWLDPNAAGRSGGGAAIGTSKLVQPIGITGAVQPVGKVRHVASEDEQAQTGVDTLNRDTIPRAFYSRWFKAPRPAQRRRDLFSKGDCEAGESGPEGQADEHSRSGSDDHHDRHDSATTAADLIGDLTPADSPQPVRQRRIQIRLRSSAMQDARDRGAVWWRAAVRSMIARTRLCQLPLKRNISVNLYCADDDEVAAIGPPVPLSRATPPLPISTVSTLAIWVTICR